MGMSEEVPVREVFNELPDELAKCKRGVGKSYAEMGAKKVAEEKSQILNEFLVFGVTRVVGRFKV